MTMESKRNGLGNNRKSTAAWKLHLLFSAWAIVQFSSCTSVNVWSFNRYEVLNNSTVKVSEDWMRAYVQAKRYYIVQMHNYEVDSIEYLVTPDSLFLPIGIKSAPDTTFHFAVSGPYRFSNSPNGVCISGPYPSVSKSRSGLLCCYDFNADSIRNKIVFDCSLPGPTQVFRSSFHANPESRYEAKSSIPIPSAIYYERYNDGFNSIVWDRRTGIPLFYREGGSDGYIVELDTVIPLQTNPRLFLRTKQAITWPGVVFPWSK